MLLIVALMTSSIISWAIIQLSKTKNWFVSDGDLQGVQKFHKELTPRIGGSLFLLPFLQLYF